MEWKNGETEREREREKEGSEETATSGHVADRSFSRNDIMNIYFPKR